MEDNRKAEAAVEETKNVLDYNDYADFGVEQIRELLGKGHYTRLRQVIT